MFIYAECRSADWRETEMSDWSRREFCQQSLLALPAARFATRRFDGESTGELLVPEEQLGRFHFWQNRDWSWYKRNIPFFESPDAELDEIYYYRWEVVTRHLRYTSPETGYIATEFAPVQGITWAGRYGAISAAADLHIDELRWLRDTIPAREYLRYFLTVAGARPRAYGFAPNWVGDALARVHGGAHPLADLLNASVENYRAWELGAVAYPTDCGFDPVVGLFWDTGRDMGAEFNLASAQLDESLRGIPGYKIRGGAGYRPDINAVMIAEARAIAELAGSLGNDAIAKQYADKARALKRKLQTWLWDPDRSFFMHRWRYDEFADGDVKGHRSIRAGSLIWETNSIRQGVGFQPQELGQGKGRELFAYQLWRYGIPDDNDEQDAATGFARAWRFLTDPESFAGKYGPRTAEKNDPWYSVIYGECRHNGQTWPFHTSRLLAGGAVLLNDYYHHKAFSRSDWYSIFRAYTALHRNGNDPFIAESHDPDRPQWTELRPIGFHYFHSSFVDLVLTGVVGLRPRRDNRLEINPLAPPEWDFFAAENILYHGRKLTIFWDRDGTRYGRGEGLQVLVDGRVLTRSKQLTRLILSLPEEQTVVRSVTEFNFAVNAEAEPFPLALASHHHPDDPPSNAVDGSIWFDAEPSKRWTTRGSVNRSQWFEIQFGRARTVHRVELFFCEDDFGVQPPMQTDLEYWQAGQWHSLPTPLLSQPLKGRCSTTLNFAPISMERLRAKFLLRPHTACGLAQFQAWGSAEKHASTGAVADFGRNVIAPA